MEEGRELDEVKDTVRMADQISTVVFLKGSS